MVFPLVIGAALAGVAGGSLLSAFLTGGSKKEATVTGEAQQISTTTISPYAFYSPAYTESWQYTPTVVIGSPQASVSTEATKKDVLTTEQTTTPNILTIPTSTTSATQTDTASAMSQLLPIAIIAIGGLLAYGMLTK